jgi:5-methylcytosine-specific restriction enzyme A
MKTKKWSAEENEALVSSYLAMLTLHNAGTKYSKAAIRRALIAGPLAGRTEGSVEFKMMNVSGCLRALGKLHLPGYQPAMNYQSDLMKEVCTQTGAQLNPAQQPQAKAA